MKYTEEELSLLQKKAKERTVKTQSIEYDLETMVKRIDNGYIKLDPDYQRRHRWSNVTSSRLIESLILNIPMPLIYLSLDIDIDTEVENDIPRYTVIDGQQRLTAIKSFLSNKLVLQDLEVLKDLEGKTYQDLPPFLIRRLEDRTIGCLRIDSTVDEQVKYDIFERLNSGSVQLTPQELRNAVVRGPFNLILKELAQNESFKKMINVSIEKKTKVDRMEDVELVLRFFSIIDKKYLSYKGGFKNFLTESMKEYNDMTLKDLEEFKQYFNSTMEIIKKEFGESAFSKYKYKDQKFTRMSIFNVSVYDALIIGVDTVLKSSKSLPTDSSERFQELFKNQEFFSSITGSVNDVGKLRVRASMAIKALSK